MLLIGIVLKTQFLPCCFFAYIAHIYSYLGLPADFSLVPKGIYLHARPLAIWLQPTFQSHLLYFCPHLMNNLICLCSLVPMSLSRSLHAPQWPSSSSMPHVFLSPNAKFLIFFWVSSSDMTFVCSSSSLLLALIGIIVLSYLYIVFSLTRM